jgi:flavin reductase (NADH)
VAAEHYRQAMRQVPSPVALVTTSHGGERFGLTATAIASVSAEPAQVLVCILAGTRTGEAVSSAGCFAVNFLTPQQESLSNRFARPGDLPKFEVGDWRTGLHSLPVLAEAMAVFECLVVNEIASGTHLVFIGRVIGAHWSERPALIYRQGGYGSY